jgi:mannose-6-phosphate isomerase-like protein (cupin superfamily)
VDDVADVSVRHIDAFESHDGGGRFLYAGRGLGVTSFGMNVARYPAGYADYPEHDHARDGQEEVYLVLEGDATLHAGDESFDLPAGTFARVGAGQRRKIVPGPDGVTVLAIGGIPGRVFEPGL